MAFIRERDGKFSVVYKVKDDKGKVHQKSETFRKKKDAEKRKHEIEYQMDTGTFKVENVHDRGTAGGVCEIIWKGKVGSLYIQCECGADKQLYSASHWAGKGK